MKSASVSIILLAAGGSKRLGRPKQLLKFGSTSLIRKLADEALASRAGDVIVVVGAEAQLMSTELKDLDLTIVENRNWESGLSSSIKTGLNAVSIESDGALLMLCDQPYVGRYLLDQIVERFQSKKTAVVACEYGQTVGIPALFPRDLFPELMRLRGDVGAKSLILKHKERLEKVSFPKGTIDIDTPDDFKSLPH